MAEKLKKIDKEYKLSDSTVNDYGFRLMTAGYQLESYSRNPIGFYMHNRDAGVIVKWEDLRIDGDSVYGKPVINLSHPRGAQTVDEVENGFLNAASMGEFVVLEYSMEPKDMLPNQNGPTITKWYNREVSLVDLPGNANALCKLFASDGSEIKLHDLISGSGSFQDSKVVADATTSTNETQTREGNKMKKITLTLPALFYAYTQLAVTATPEEVEGKLADLVTKAESADQLTVDNLALTKERNALKAKLAAVTTDRDKAEVVEMLDAALKAKKISVELKELYATDYEANPTKLKTVLAAHGVYSGVVNQIDTATKEAAKQYEGKSWQELFEGNMLPELKAKHYDLYKEVYKKEHGQYPA